MNYLSIGRDGAVGILVALARSTGQLPSYLSRRRGAVTGPSTPTRSRPRPVIVHQYNLPLRHSVLPRGLPNL
jgi:hypothetical protein